jgi:hypothetical protein
MSGEGFELILFATEPGLVAAALAGGIGSFIADWETRGKERRQRGAGTEVNRDTPADLARLAALGAPRRYCRIDRFGAGTRREVEAAVEAGATCLFLPMVESPQQVETTRRWLDGRAELGILIETETAIRRAAELAAVAPGPVYVGLNDLAISRGSDWLFTAVADRTVERLRAAFPEHRFGFGGVTVADGGAPLPCRLLLAEMARLGCSFSFLRRSFKRDVAGRDMATEVAALGALWRRLAARRPAEVERDRRELEGCPGAWQPRVGRPAAGEREIGRQGTDE